MSLLLRILSHALTSPTRIAVVDDRREYTFAQLAAGAMFVADHITRTTDKPRVGVILPTGGGFPLALLGGWLAGRTVVPFNYLLNQEELAYVVRDSGIDLLVTAGPMLDHLGGPSRLPPGVNLLKLENLDFEGFPPMRLPPRVDPEQDAVILYTSGTSGKPKGVRLTHDNLESNTRAATVHARLSQGDTFLGVLPQFHSFGLTALTLLPLSLAARVVYSARFTPKRIVELVARHKPDVMMAVPSMYGVLLTVKDATADHFKSIRIAVSGGEALPRALATQFRERFGVRLLEGYGLTETSPITSWCTPHAFRDGSVGTVLPGVDVRILDDHNRPLPAGGEGEIVIAGHNIMKGYLNLPDATAAAIATLELPGSANSRWFRTGDLGRFDADGFLYITGRKKDMLKVAGEMVIPREIEETLARHPSVREAAVIGKRDEMRGEVPVAFVEIKEGETFDENALRQWCRDNLAAFKVPRDIRRIDALPRNATGKVMRRQLSAD